MVKKISKHIEIVRTSIKGLSSMSIKSSDAVFALLEQHYETVGITTVSTTEDLKKVVEMKPDLVFIGLKHLPGNRPHSKLWVSSYFERHQIAHTGSPQAAIQFEQDKPMAKQRMLELGIATSAYTVIKNGTYPDMQNPNDFPLFVKPASLGAGQGVDDKSIVHNQTQLYDKIQSLSDNFAADALIEKYLSGREFSVAVLKDEHSQEYIGMPLELLPGADSNGDYMLSHRLKSGILETPVVPVTDEKLHDSLVQLALDAFHALGARDYGRIDIRLDTHGKPHFLEANLIPCIIEGSGNFPKACMLNKNMDFKAMILQIVRLGLTRSATKPTNEHISVITNPYTSFPVLPAV